MKTRLIKSILASIFLLSATAFAGTATYSATNTIFESPERGFCNPINNSESFNASVVRNNYPGQSIGEVLIRLDRFKNGASLDSCFLSNLANSFATARVAGVKLRVTFSYNYGPASYYAPYTACNGQVIQNDGNDASLSTILNHISQLSSTLNQYSDVIYEIDAGFIGQWGEWHGSTHGNDTLTAHNQVITNERTYFPSNRHISLRRPAYKGNYLRGLGYGLTPGLFPQLGYHNQDFVDDTDMFTDPQGILSSSDCRTFYDNDVSFTANGADAASNGGSIAGDTAVNRMQQYHYTIFFGYPNLLSYWQTSFPSQYATMQRRLGYRFQVTQATTPNTAIRGQTYTISVNLVNNGFAKLMNYRAGYVVVVNGNSAYAALLTDSNGSYDLENLTLAAGIKTYTANFTLPNTFPIGTAQATLWLPDAAANLDGSPLFSIRVDGTNANWDATAGRTILSLNNIQVQ